MEYDILMLAYPVVDIIIEMAGKFPIEGDTARIAKTITPQPGGSGSILITASRMGSAILPAGPVSDDYYGQFLIDSFRKEGIDTGEMVLTQGYPMSQALCIVDDGGCHSMLSNFSRGEFAFRTGIEPLLSKSLSFYLSAYYLYPEDNNLASLSLETVRLLRGLGKPLFFDTSPVIGRICPSVLDEVIELSDVLTMNGAEMEMLTGTSDLDASARILKNKTDALIIIKFGARGCFVTSNKVDGKWYPGFDVKLVDTTGCGDSFIGAFMHAYMKGFNLDTCVVLANAVGAVMASKFGTGFQVPTFDEVVSLLEKNGYSVPSVNKRQRRFVDIDFSV